MRNRKEETKYLLGGFLKRDKLKEETKERERERDDIVMMRHWRV